MCEKILLNRMVIDADYDLSNLETNNHLNLFKGLDNFRVDFLAEELVFHQRDFPLGE